MSLDIKIEAEKLRELYKTSKSQRLISALVIGPTGSGKTRLLETCRRPIHIDSFDPDGLTTVRRGIEAGYIIPDTRYEKESPTDPFAFELWDEEFHRRLREGYYEQLGTYALDGITMWSESIMNLVLKGMARKADRDANKMKDGRMITKIETDLLKIPQENDWPLQMNIIVRAMTAILALPCDVIVIGHTEDKKDKQGKLLQSGLYITGRLITRIPRLFEELYYMHVEEASSGKKFNLCTTRTDRIDARTRIGRDVFDDKEVPDIMALLKKAGLKPEHKEGWK